MHDPERHASPLRSSHAIRRSRRPDHRPNRTAPNRLPRIRPKRRLVGPEINDETWEPRVKSALRLLADSGFGGERSRGWGRAAEPQFTDASGLFRAEGHTGVHPGAWWLLSLYSPHETDTVDWTRGDYSTVTRAGWTDSPAGSVKKKHVRMIEEGSVLMAPSLRGRAVDVAPEGFAHPAWRSGLALAVPVPVEVEI
jgi:CRISPR type III-A-associated RAMP protein Csm4